MQLSVKSSESSGGVCSDHTEFKSHGLVGFPKGALWALIGTLVD